MLKGYKLFEVAQLFRRVAGQHPFVNTFFEGVYRVEDSSNVKYPCLAFTVNSITKQSNLLVLEVNLLWADRMTENRDNIMTASSVGTEVLNELLNAVDEFTDISVQEGYTIRPFWGQFSDDCAGVTTTATIQVPNPIGDCHWLDPDCLKC